LAQASGVPAAADAELAEPVRNPWIVLLSVALGMFMVVIDITILNIALPEISEAMDASLAEIEWTLIAYTLALTGLVPFFGRISDVLGRKRLFILGMIIFASGSVLAALSQNIYMLIGARLVQAVGGAMVSSNSLAIITDTFPEGKRGVAMGLQSIIISGGAAVGPTLGGFLVTHFGWEAVFLINVPVGIVASSVAFAVLPPLKSNRQPEPVDWVGAGLLVGGLTPFLLGITKGESWGWTSPLVLALIVGGVVAIIGFVLWEQRNRFPLMDLSLFRIRAFWSGQLAGLFVTMAFGTLSFMMPFYWQAIRGYSAQEAGLMVLPMPIAIGIFAPTSGRISDRYGVRGVACTGLVVLIVGLLLMSQVTAHMAVWDVLWRYGTVGVGLGLFFAPNSNGIMSAAPAERRGIASGIFGMFRYTGQSIAIASAGTLFALFATTGAFELDHLPSPADVAAVQQNPEALHALESAFIHGMRAAILGSIPFAAIALAMSWMRGRTGGTGRERTVEIEPAQTKEASRRSFSSQA
jgi:EmrB/QacA subfamily drug resistance transporter